jgi:serine phosphatase RsbU (regulator of sigma subunit)
VPLCGLRDRAVAARTVLEPGATLLLFSDGLIERRRRPLPLQLDRLASAAAGRRGLPAEPACDGILAAMTGGEPAEDDVVLLCVRRVAAQSGRDAGGPAVGGAVAQVAIG